MERVELIAGATAHIVATAMQVSGGERFSWADVEALTSGVHEILSGQTLEEQLKATNEHVASLEAQVARLEMAIQGLTSSRR